MVEITNIRDGASLLLGYRPHNTHCQTQEERELLGDTQQHQVLFAHAPC